MDELRWILLGLGVVIIVGVYGYARLQDWRRDGPPWRRRTSTEREPFAGYDEPDIDADDPLTVDPIEPVADRGGDDGSDNDGILGPARVVSEGGTAPEDPAAPPERAAPEEPVAEEVSVSPHHHRRDEPAPQPEPSPADPPIPAFLRARGRQQPAAGPAAEQRPAPAPRPEPAPAPSPAAPSAPAGPVEEPELDLGFPPEPEPAPEPAAPPVESMPADIDGEEKVIALSVMAPTGREYNGADLAAVLESAGLRLTPQGIFRRGLDTGEGTVALFTAANIIEPGTFDAQDPASVSTPGVVLIMQLPGPFDGLATFEQMLTTARRLADTLGGQLLDGRRCDLTTQAIEHIREELLEYRRRAHLASRSRRRS
ncbi:cell division protein ZipA [Spiribacter sp. 221]|uniref:cell division protein ZipA n=1 Tax=Spiribacter onubensis TaxID=3122420 RepID=UPI00349F26FA